MPQGRILAAAGPNETGGQSDVTFISLVRFPEINDSNWFEVKIPQPDATISTPGGEALFTDIHAENP